MNKRILGEGNVKRVRFEGCFLVGASDDRDTLPETGVGGTFGRQRILLVAQIQTRRLLDAIVLFTQTQCRGAGTTSQIDVTDLTLTSFELGSQFEHVIGYLLACLAVRTLLIQVDIVPFSKVNVGRAVTHDLGVEFKFIFGIILSFDAVHVFLQVAGFSVDSGVDLGGDGFFFC